MSREVRRVPADWKHPTDTRGRFLALHDGKDYERQVRSWDEGAAKWPEGLRKDYKDRWIPVDAEYADQTYVEWNGERPDADDYMPRWAEAEATHLMMYETTSEGTPISPAFATPEELARWLVDNNASAFADSQVSYEGWLRVARGGWAPSAIFTPATGMVSGVDALRDVDETTPRSES